MNKVDDLRREMKKINKQIDLFKGMNLDEKIRAIELLYEKNQLTDEQIQELMQLKKQQKQIQLDQEMKEYQLNMQNELILKRKTIKRLTAIENQLVKFQIKKVME